MTVGDYGKIGEALVSFFIAMVLVAILVGGGLALGIQWVWKRVNIEFHWGAGAGEKGSHEA